MLAGELLRLALGATGAFVALLMLRAALHKLADRARFEGVLTDYGLVPDAALRPFSIALPVLEVLAAAGLAVPGLAPAGAVLAAALLLAYAAAMAAALVQGRREIDCGCGGPPLPLGWSLVARNLVLAALLAPLALGAAVLRSGSEIATAWALALVALGGWAAVELAAANHHRMRAGESLA